MQPEPRMTHDQKRASFCLSYMLAMIDNLKSNAVPKSAAWNRLNGLEEGTNRALDHYRIHRLAPGDLDRAAKLFDRLDREIAALYPTSQRKRQNRRQKRHSRSSVEPVIRTVHKSRRSRTWARY